MFNIEHVNLEHLIRVVLWLAVSVLAVDFAMVLYILMRRLGRRRYYNRKDAAKERFTEPVRRFLAGELSAEELVSLLQTGRSRPARDAVQGLLMGNLTASNRPAVTTVVFHLGLIDVWAAEAFGKRRARQLIRHITEGAALPPAKKPRFAGIRRRRLFCVARAHAVAQLGQLDPEFAQVFMNEAMQDPSPYVGRANIAAIGRNREAFEVTVLLEVLRQSVEGANELPMLSVKTALVRYPVQQLAHFTPYLDDPNSRFRFFVVDSIREICDSAATPLSAQDFPDSLTRWFLDKAPVDESIDVRARSARVIRHFHNAGAVAALRALLHDPDEFVRLHTVRACADSHYSELLSDIVQRMTDAKWRVREASIKTLAAFGLAGRQQLSQNFLNTSDRYTSEQIAEEMQRGGIVADLLPALGSSNGEAPLAANVYSRLVDMGKTSLLTDLLAREARLSRWGAGTPLGDPQRARARLLDILLAAPTPQLMATMQALADRKDDQLSGRAQALLQSGNIQTALSKAAAAGGERTHA